MNFKSKKEILEMFGKKDRVLFQAKTHEEVLALFGKKPIEKDINGNLVFKGFKKEC